MRDKKKEKIDWLHEKYIYKSGIWLDFHSSSEKERKKNQSLIFLYIHKNTCVGMCIHTYLYPILFT